MPIQQYDWNYGGMEAYPCGEYVRFDDHRAVGNLAMDTIDRLKAENERIVAAIREWASWDDSYRAGAMGETYHRLTVATAALKALVKP